MGPEETKLVRKDRQHARDPHAVGVVELTNSIYGDRFPTMGKS